MTLYISIKAYKTYTSISLPCLWSYAMSNKTLNMLIHRTLSKQAPNLIVVGIPLVTPYPADWNCSMNGIAAAADIGAITNLQKT